MLIELSLESEIDIKIANRYRRIADEHALKILNRAFVTFYPLTDSLSKSLPLFLDHHQVKGIEWILTRSRSYLAHAPGAGKTLQAIVASILTSESGQTVFIVPPDLTINWEREIWKWTKWAGLWPSVRIVPDSSLQNDLVWQSDFIICPDSMITKKWVLEKLHSIKIKFIAVDEASRFKEPTAQRSIALFGGVLKDDTKTSGIVGAAKHAVLLDGSPMLNRPLELWAPTFAMAPECIDFMDEADFGFAYCGARRNEYGKWEFKGSNNENELRERLQRSFMHVVPESMLDHPERKRSILFMSEDPRSPEQKTWERKHLHTLNFDDISEDMNQGEMAKFRRELGIRKMPWIADYTADRLKYSKEAILLFAWHRDVVLGLAERLRKFNPGVIMGGTKNEEREKLLHDFQAGRRELLILNIAAGGRGHNIQRADRCIFGEWGWNDEQNKQCEKRASRRGRDKDLPVRCDYIVAPHSMDEPILNGVFRKAESTKRIIG